METQSISKKAMILLIAAIVLFLVSFFLPALDDFPGYWCALVCLISVWNWEILNILYYFPFTLSNIIMVMLPILLVTKWKKKRIKLSVIVIQIILSLHVVSWWVVNLIPSEGWHGNYDDEKITITGTSLTDWSITDIKIGYYVWFASMLLMLWYTIGQRKWLNKA